MGLGVALEDGWLVGSGGGADLRAFWGVLFGGLTWWRLFSVEMRVLLDQVTIRSKSRVLEGSRVLCWVALLRKLSSAMKSRTAIQSRKSKARRRRRRSDRKGEGFGTPHMCHWLPCER